MGHEGCFWPALLFCVGAVIYSIMVGRARDKEAQKLSGQLETVIAAEDGKPGVSVEDSRVFLERVGYDTPIPKKSVVYLRALKDGSGGIEITFLDSPRDDGVFAVKTMKRREVRKYIEEYSR